MASLGAIGTPSFPKRITSVVAFVPSSKRSIKISGQTGDLLMGNNAWTGLPGWPSASRTISGIVQQSGLPVVRQVFAYSRSETSRLIGRVFSKSDGTFSIPAGNWSGQVDVFAIDPNTPPVHNTQVLGGILPY